MHRLSLNSYSTKNTVSLICVLCVILFNYNVAATSIVTVDQKYTPDSRLYFVQCGIDDPIGQEFTPTIAKLDLVEVYLQNNDARHTGEALVLMNIRFERINGTVIATSDPLSIRHGTDGIVKFDFSTSVNLTPNEIHVVELVYLSGPNIKWFGKSFGAYLNGRSIVKGVTKERSDLWFKVGVKGEIPNKTLTIAPLQSKYR